MSFDYVPAPYRMEFGDDDPVVPGLVVVLRRAGVDAKIAYEEMPSFEGKWAPMRDLAVAVAELLLSWNLTEYGRPVPCNRGEFLRRDDRLVLPILGRWVQDMRAALEGEQQAAPAEVAGDEFDPSDIPVEPLAAVS